MVERRVGLLRWVVLGLALAILASSSVAGVIWYRTRSRRLELAEARAAMEAGRFGMARQHLVRLADRWPDDGEILLLLGECELERGRRETAMASETGRDPEAERRHGQDAAIAAWARVPRASPAYSKAALLAATNLINTGRYAPAEKTLIAALNGPAGADRYDLERTLSRLYRFEGRLDDVRRVLRASWCRSPNPGAVLRELWLLDHSPTPVEAWFRALEAADKDDDRVWLGKGNHAILTGRFEEAASWLDRCLKRRPEDPSVWEARLALARATEDDDAFWESASHLPDADFDAAAIGSMRAWLAARHGDSQAERRELTLLIQSTPGDSQAIDRLAVLSFQAGMIREAEQFRRRKAELDRAQDTFRSIILTDSPRVEQAEEL
ncbi:MAG: tetratricopeptide repeat protein, partial [Isosphaeraceae bacterium]